MSVDTPVTVWQDTQGLTEFGNIGQSYTVDPFGVYLVDPSATYIVDTGVDAQLIPATVWTEDDSI